MDLQEPSKLLIYLVGGQAGKQGYTNTNNTLGYKELTRSSGSINWDIPDRCDEKGFITGWINGT